MTIVDTTDTRPEIHPGFPNPVGVAADITELAHSTATGALASGNPEEMGTRRYIVDEKVKKLGSGMVEVSHLLVTGPKESEDSPSLEPVGAPDRKTTVAVETTKHTSKWFRRFSRTKKDQEGGLVASSKIVAPASDSFGDGRTELPIHGSSIVRVKDSDLVNPTVFHEVVPNLDGTVKNTLVKVGQDRIGRSAIEVTRHMQDPKDPSKTTIEKFRSSELRDTSIDEAKKAEAIASRVSHRIVDRVATLQLV